MPTRSSDASSSSGPTPQQAAEAVFARQLRYERAVAGCSQLLLSQAQDEQAREELLNRALAALLDAARVSRIGMFAMGEDPALGPTFRMIAEAASSDLPSRLAASRTPAPAGAWSTLNARLRSGEVVHTRFRDLYADQPAMLEQLDVRSILFCPIHFGGEWWGYLAYGDAAEERLWDEDEICLIHNAAQMFAGTLQRWQAEDELERRVIARTAELASANLRLSREIIERERAEQTVRQNLAQELHDVVAQTLYGLSLFARAGKDALQQRDDVKLERSLDYIEQNALQALKEMRLLLYHLRPEAANGARSLTDRLNLRFDEVERRLGIEASVEIGAALPAREIKQEEIYRIIIEALNNSLKHAGATRVHVGVRSADGGVEVTVRDNGSGFDTAGKHTGMGLGSMQQRAGTLRGRLAINSRPGEGTEVCLWVSDSVAGEAP